MTDYRQIWLTLPNDGRIEKEYLLDNIKYCRQSANYKKYSYKDLAGDDDHTHCNICMQTISGVDTVYSADNNFVCESCYRLFVDDPNFKKNIADLKPADRPT